MPFPVVLFLDFDGVLHPAGGIGLEAGASRRRMGRLPLLEALLRESALIRVGIVISSTWRVVQTAAQLRSQFAPDMRERVIGCTPQLAQYATRHARQEEVEAWLAAHPEVRAWVALDDEPRHYAQESHTHLVLTDSNTGFSVADAGVLRERLLLALADAENA